jgi:hypothetical protein
VSLVAAIVFFSLLEGVVWAGSENIHFL